MTDQERKAMEMALEWMEAIVNSNWRNWEELASPEEFERWVKSRANHSAVALRQALAQGKQEPVAWTLTEFLDKRETTTNAPLWFVDPVNSAWTPLYTAPPSKRWASLTDEEIEEAANNAGFGHINIALEIEAKLKEKNHD